MNKHKLIDELTKQTQEVVKLLPVKGVNSNDTYLQLLVALISIQNDSATTPKILKRVNSYRNFLRSISFASLSIHVVDGVFDIKFKLEQKKHLERQIKISFLEGIAPKNQKEITKQEIRHLKKINDKLEEILTFISIHLPYNKEGQFKLSAHFVENKVNTKRTVRIRDKQTGKEEVITPRIVLKPLQDRVIIALSKELYLVSDKDDHRNPNFFKGNATTRTNSDKAALRISPQQLYKLIYPNKNIGGSKIEQIKKALKELSDKKHIVIYSRKVGQKREVIRTRETLINVFEIAKMSEWDFKKFNLGNNETFESKKDYIIEFNPIFRHEIQNKYILLPNDINQRIESHTKGRLKNSTILMRDYLFLMLSGKHYKNEIGLKLLEQKLSLQRVRDKYRRIKAINLAFETFEKMGLVKRYAQEKAKNGEEKFVIELNPDFK